ncbi:MAG: citrate/2-methylcitrate synthase [Planctomycetota bacterium]|jgi:2-methylcitrate synthase
MSHASNRPAAGTSTTRAGLDGVLAGETRLSTVGVSGVGLTYLGYSIEDLAEHATFEEVAYLLLYGELPTAAQVNAFRDRIVANRGIPPELGQVLERIPSSAHPMDVLRTAASMLGTLEPENHPQEALHVSERLLGIMPSVLLYWYRFHQSGHRIDPTIGGESIAEQFLWLLHGRRPEPLHVRAMDVSLILYAEHEWNASTFTARVVASTLSDFYSAITAAIGALRGPLHGGANEAAMELIDSMRNPDDAETRLLEMLSRKEKIMGFGHRVYKSCDPRSDIIQVWARKLCEATDLMLLYDISERIESVMRREKKMFPNLDFYSASMYRSLGIPTAMFTPIFVLSRISGWSAHILEQRANNRLIRPLAEYVGPRARPWQSIETRS